ncbi:pyridoxamine 5'-phosphate oxidase family protein [Solirubrobacter phytolaccae]
MQPHEIAEVLSRPYSQELLARDVTRLAYVATDGTPRCVPIAFAWSGTELVLCTSKNAPKLPALRAHPTVALTIDTEVHPPKILLIRGEVELDEVDAKLIDFETTLPTAVEELVREREARQNA